jgi:hypothetical protein
VGLPLMYEEIDFSRVDIEELPPRAAGAGVRVVLWQLV